MLSVLSSYIQTLQYLRALVEAPVFENVTDGHSVVGSKLRPQHADGVYMRWASAVSAQPRPKKSWMRNAVEWLAVITTSVLLVSLAKHYLVEPFFIPSGSMESTLNVRDRVLVNKVTYRFQDIGRLDVIVFKEPVTSGRAGNDHNDLIKRVMGLSGETIESRSGIIYVNGNPLPDAHKLSENGNDIPFQVIPAGKVWVMGDNRAHSLDSRAFGPVDKSEIVGQAFVKVWPPSAIRTL